MCVGSNERTFSSPEMSDREAAMSRIVVKELRLRNYKAFADARLILDDVTFLVGRNGAGKSTLMDAFSFISEAVTDSLATALERRGNLDGIRLRQSPKEPPRDVSVAVCLEVSDAHGSSRLLYGFQIGRDPGSSGYAVKREVLRSSPKERNLHSFLSIERVQDHSQQLIIGNASPIPDAETLVLPLVAGLQRLEDNVQLRAILERLALISAHQLSPHSLRDEPEMNKRRRLARNGGNAGDVLKYIRPADHEWINQHLGIAFPGIRDVQARERARRRVIVFTQEGEEDRLNDFDAAMMSDGTLRAFGTLLALRQTPSALDRATRRDRRLTPSPRPRRSPRRHRGGKRRLPGRCLHPQSRNPQPPLGQGRPHPCRPVGQGNESHLSSQ
jgi:predicted ATPase